LLVSEPSGLDECFSTIIDLAGSVLLHTETYILERFCTHMHAFSFILGYVFSYIIFSLLSLF
jgi:hypothetical protein